MKLIIAILVIFPFCVFAQPVAKKLENEFGDFLFRLNHLEGNIYLDSAFSNADVKQCKAFLTDEEFKDIVSIIKTQQLKQFYVEASFKSALKEIHLISRIEFSRSASRRLDAKEIWPCSQTLDSIAYQAGVSNPDNSKLLAQRKAIENLIQASTCYEHMQQFGSLSAPKLCTVLAVFASEKCFLIIYSISQKRGVLEAITKVEFGFY